ncbi:histidine phosphatase superfamily [Catenaria anguillulae PL171]|uniref:Histidine phosphatase superfamily n=1 Tax=Catenaria anguillulae PL171 TaxID=765915 RepID=A0A1Y2H9X4_9FUNG|nr:histidine phosphatase superfamily [Catenaria anguillulae PL171]
MPPRASRGDNAKSQPTNSPKRNRGSGPRNDDDAIRADDDGAPLVDGVGKQGGSGRKRQASWRWLESPRVWVAEVVWRSCVAVLIVVAAANAKQGAADIKLDQAQSSPTVLAVPAPEPAKPASIAVPVPPGSPTPNRCPPILRQGTSFHWQETRVEENRAGGGMRVHPEPVPQPRLALGSWDYCEAPVMLPKTGDDDPNESTHTLHHAFIFVRHGDRTPTTWPVASANFSATPAPTRTLSRTGTKRYPTPQWPGNCSTDFNRTIASAVHFAMGVYAPQRLPLPPAQLIDTQHPNEDPLSLSNPSLKNTIFDYFDPTDLLSGPHGLPKLLALFDMVATARCHDISLCLPESLPVGHGPGPCVSPVVLDRLLVWAGKQFMRVSRDFARATGGRALRELVVESRANPGLSVFATHDTTIAVLLRALDVKVDVWPHMPARWC